MARSEGKYAAVIPGLPKLPPADAGYQAKVEEAKARVTNRDATFLAESYVKWRAEKARIEEILSGVNLQIAAYEQLLADSQEARAAGWGAYGVKENALRLPDGSTIRVQQEPQAKVVDEEAYRQWCLANGYERKMRLLWQTTNGIVKERLLAGEPEPDGTEVYSYTKVVFAKKGAE